MALYMLNFASDTLVYELFERGIANGFLQVIRFVRKLQQMDYKIFQNWQ